MRCKRRLGLWALRIDAHKSPSLGKLSEVCHILHGETCNMRSIGFLLAFFCAAGLLVPAQDDTNAGVQSKIIALEKAWNQAYKLGDVRALDGILDAQIVLINDDGTVQ